MSEQEFIQRAMSCERKLYRIAHSILYNDADCEDAVQEALIRAWQGIHTLKQPQYFDTWLVRILVNTCKDLCRKRRPTVALSDTLRANLRTNDSPHPELYTALGRLPEKLRLAMVLHYIEGYDIAQVAGILHIPTGTVKWRLHQGRNDLRKLLGEEEDAWARFT